jgi:hypothetical protein
MSKIDTLTLRHKYFDGKVHVVLNQSHAAQLAAHLFLYVGSRKKSPELERSLSGNLPPGAATCPGL